MSDEQAHRGATDGVSVHELVLADAPERWSALGFTVLDDAIQLGAVRLRLAGADAGRGILGWSLRGISSTALDGLSTTRAHGAGRDGSASGPDASASGPDGFALGAGADRAAAEHPNGVVAIDHVVAMTPALDRTVQALKDAGLDLRRIREQPTPAGAPRQAFFRLGAEILEVVQEPQQVLEQHGGADRPARLWGLALIAQDLDRTLQALAGLTGAPRPAVQPGRRIATLRRSAGLALPVALMSAGVTKAA